MQEVCVPVTIPGAHGKLIETPARVQVFVNLIRGDARGIHMSRLYLALDRRLGEDSLSPRSVHALLQDFLSSHVDLSDRAMVRIGFDLLLKRPALVSDKAGWKPYPVVLTGILDKPHFTLELATEILYSSTCPASAALARQLIQEQFRSDFPVTQALDREAVVAWLGSERGIVATPHSQRSRLAVRTRLQPGFQELPIVELIDRIEGALKTPVQTAVKREDEQAFARLNGANLMFCEDAARRVHTALQADPHILDFWARATHEESLHAHDAVAVTTKGVAGGYTGASEWVAS
jgi:GTP cyclohydrolase I